MHWKEGSIDGCIVKPLTPFGDERGWLAEIFRNDELPPDHYPAMGYISVTRPGVSRGPHEHRQQTDLFAFFDGSFRLYLWDAREGSPTAGHRAVYDVGEAHPMSALIPPGVVHAYRNTGNRSAFIVNCPNRLHAGWNRREVVDEIRHEDDAESPYALD